ncbi:septal ring lytic transglycosylase RlpA family protein [Noviherbaspirillum sp. L7-7A]|uniref:septal ring lytic transglycosylase RlpA family protein n=1 Tax=Noviherbaspirillum sp. L7-7A TaxID=2850560 RepID=UPI001C2C23D6|nr:septal ring lytic transglycosylase RlpA family protein [Noviherbaspirillum sp. L7-7A]MBV0881549.1 septal ring lytic transglycosylase RlpA family protein [Noviherbaspirillum sp. L7-7A]
MIRSFLSVCAATALFSLINEATAQSTGHANTAHSSSTHVSSGKVAWYGSKFNGRITASGERFSARALTMAHKTLPFGTKVRVTNLKNKKSVVVRVNDRGPSSPELVGDVTYAAAQRLGMFRSGVVEAKLDVVETPSKRQNKQS